MNENIKIGCDRVAELIVEYIDGELDTALSDSIKLHIKSCPDCQKLYRDMALVCSVAAESAYEAPEELHGRVMSAVSVERARRSRTLDIRRLTRRLGVGVAAMLLICVGIAGGFKLLPKIMDAEIAYEAPTENAPGASIQIMPADTVINNSDYYFAADKAEEIESPSAEQIMIYNSFIATPAPPGAITGAAPVATEAAPKDDAASSPELEAPAEAPAATESTLPRAPLAEAIIGEWAIEVDGKTIRLNIYEGEARKFIIYTENGMIKGNYSLDDNFLTLKTNTEEAVYIVNVTENREMTLHQISTNRLF